MEELKFNIGDKVVVVSENDPKRHLSEKINMYTVKSSDVDFFSPSSLDSPTQVLFDQESGMELNGTRIAYHLKKDKLSLQSALKDFIETERYKVRKIKKKRRTDLLVLMRDRKISQTLLALLSDLETHQIQNIVTGQQKDLLMSTAKKICNALDVSLDEAFGD